MKAINIILLIFFSILLGWYIKSIQDYRLYKYIPLDNVLEEMLTREYDFDNYNCLDFSKDAQIKLKDQGINSSIIVGTNGSEYDHAFLGIWIDSVNNQFIQNYKFKDVYKGAYDK